MIKLLSIFSNTHQQIFIPINAVGYSWQHVWLCMEVPQNADYMKFQLSILAALFVTVLVSCGTTNNTSVSENAAFGTPDRIQTVFSNQYPGANYITWNVYNSNTPTIMDWEFAGWPAINETDYTVRFTLDTFNYHAWYNDSGDWIGSAYVVRTAKALPETVSNTLKAQFGAYNVDGAVREFRRDDEAYEIKLKNGEANKLKLLVDNNGNILKQKAGW